MEYRLLGTLEVVHEGRRVPIERRLSRVLLAFLLLHANEPVSVDRLVDELWGEAPPPTAKASLQNHVHRLRKALGAETIVLRAGAYELRVDPEEIDLRRFERLVAEARDAGVEERATMLRAALALWRGPPLEDQVFEPFAQDEIPRLEELRLEALEERVAADLALGRAAELVLELEELIAEHPFRERLRGQLVLALHRSGREADALAAASEARRVWAAELGMEPKSILALERALREDDPRLEVHDVEPEPGTLASRRTVSVLFCDVVDSTRLATELDPEAFRAVVSRYFDAARGAIARHGGTVEKFIGDAVVAVFGVPELHEDDALRAARAAVETRAAVEDLELRIAVTTGEVVVVPAPGQDLHVAGAAVAHAARLQARSASGQIVLDELTRRLLGSSVRATRVVLDDGPAWLLEEVVGAPAPFSRRHDAPLVGRDDELSRLRKAFEAARDEGRCRVVTILGEPGIGKTRLARELAEAVADEARVLVGRCVAYGEGATYLPLAEIVRQAAPEPSLDGIRALLEGEDDADAVARRVAELVGMAESPAAAGEAFWAVRRLFETLARDKPLVVVIDDVHWAEPTLLDLVEYLGEWTAAPLLLLCPGRPELVERRPGWAGPTSTGFAVELEPLPDEDARVLVELLAGGSRLAPGETAALVDRAGGNPLFAEQLVALGQESPDARPPASLEALLASRIDRLRAGEVRVLRRAAVVGRQFARGELLDPAPTDERALRGLVRRRLIHPAGADAFRFHHALVRDVAYHGTPKADRADLHERLADRLDVTAPDEIVGYHLEQAYRYSLEIGARDEHAEALATNAGRRLGRAGERAWRRGDPSAATNLLTRANDLLPQDDAQRRELLVVLGSALWMGGSIPMADEIFERARAAAVEAHDDRVEKRARLELANLRLFVDPAATTDGLLGLLTEAAAAFEETGDHEWAGRAWSVASYVYGGLQCNCEAALDAASKAIRHARSRGAQPETSLHQAAAALYYGPIPATRAIARCAALLENAGRGGACGVHVFLGGLEALRGRFEAARALAYGARGTFEELGWTVHVATTFAAVVGDIEVVAGDLAAAESVLRASCSFLADKGDRVHLATQASQLADVLVKQGRPEEAGAWVATAGENAAALDTSAQILRRIPEAKLLSLSGSNEQAATLAREASALADGTDVLNFRGRASLALAEVLQAAGRPDEACRAAESAARHFTRKGNIPERETARRLRAELVVA